MTLGAGAYKVGGARQCSSMRRRYPKQPYESSWVNRRLHASLPIYPTSWGFLLSQHFVLAPIFKTGFDLGNSVLEFDLGNLVWTGLWAPSKSAYSEYFYASNRGHLSGNYALDWPHLAH